MRDGIVGSALTTDDLNSRSREGNDDDDDDYRPVSNPVKLTTWVFEAGTKEGQLARATRAIEDLARERDSALYRWKEVSSCSSRGERGGGSVSSNMA